MDRLSKLGINKTVLVVLFAFIAYSVICRYLMAVNRNAGGEVYLQYMLRMEAVLSIPFFFYVFNRFGNKIQKETRGWILTIALFLFFELLNTLLFSDIRSYILPDAVFWIFFISSIFLGCSTSFWEKFLPYAQVIIVITSIVSLYEILFGGFSYMRGSWDSESYLYDIQLGFSPLLLLLVYYILSRHKSYASISVSIFVLYVITQFLFQKRLPLFRTLLDVIFLLYVIKSYFRSSFVSYRLEFLLIVAVVAAIIFVPNDYYAATIDRFFQDGSISQTTTQDDRYLIAGKAVDITMESLRTLLFGHGLGGAIIGDFYGKTISVNGRVVNGISEIEVGAVTILLRYGIIFFIILYGYMLKLILGFKKYKKNCLALACWSYLCVFFIMTLVGESFPGASVPIRTLLLGLVIGYLSIPESQIKLDTMN